MNGGLVIKRWDEAHLQSRQNISVLMRRVLHPKSPKYCTKVSTALTMAVIQLAAGKTLHATLFVLLNLFIK